MLTSSGGVSRIGVPKACYANIKRDAGSKPSVGQHYDSVTFSSTPEGESAFRLSLAGQLSQEVRTATTTGDVQKLRQAVASGEYKPDPMSIAGKMLFLVGV